MALQMVVSKLAEELVLTRGSVGMHGERILMLQEEKTVLKREVGKGPARRSSGLIKGLEASNVTPGTQASDPAQYAQHLGAEHEWVCHLFQFRSTTGD